MRNPELARIWLTRILIAVAALSVFVHFGTRVRLDWKAKNYVYQVNGPSDPEWLYQAFDALRKPGDALGILGWAAHVWVRSGLIPATREPTTEYIAGNLGIDGYYRKRYLQALNESRPAFFLQAVGPEQFRFEDRNQNGALATIPGLAELVEKNYVPFVDNGSSGLYVDRARFNACCRYVQIDASSNTQLQGFAFDAVPDAFQTACELNEFCLGSYNPADKTARSLSFVLPHPRAARGTQLSSTGPSRKSLLFIPFATGSWLNSGLTIAAKSEAPNGRVSVLRTCSTEVMLRAINRFSVCVLELDALSEDDHWTMSVTDSGDVEGQWVAIGRPVLVDAPL